MCAESVVWKLKCVQKHTNTHTHAHTQKKESKKAHTATHTAHTRGVWVCTHVCGTHMSEVCILMWVH
eukprot:NODE_5565_length_282_cov_4.896996_g5482_i0.p2 GENE.NODE_5565_length_282_cov_4.896996_g5482_i0~~NODE_5565_length_282_cov_4.896996_g5482_i0.p2  ORF type:complete len:67 (-),score=22.26 NODE_5565_length_282_cov_4.896996_g5482_i0:67-267(-)